MGAHLVGPLRVGSLRALSEVVYEEPSRLSSSLGLLPEAFLDSKVPRSSSCLQ